MNRARTYVRCECGAPIQIDRAVPAEELARSIWICDDCVERQHPGHREEVRREADYLASLPREPLTPTTGQGP